MNYKLTLGLLGLLVVLGAYLYFSEIRPGPQQADEPSTEVIDFNAVDVNSIKVSYQGKSIELKKQDSNWKLTKPEEAETQPYVVDGLVARIAPLNATRVLSGTLDPLSAYGLDTPQAEAIIGTTGNRSAFLEVGNNTPDGSSFYVKREDSNKVYIVSSSVISDVIKLATDPPKATPTPTPSSMGTPAPTGTPLG